MINARDFQKRIDRWARNNFEYIDKVGFGIVEEIGEYCHAHMKFRQKIRGSRELKGSPDELKRQDKLVDSLKDALGDAMIYTLHWSEANEAFISFHEVQQYIETSLKSRYTEYQVLGLLLMDCGRAFMLASQDETEVDSEEYRVSAQRIFCRLALLATLNRWDWELVLNDTWDKVSKRNWRKFPKNGLTE